MIFKKLGITGNRVYKYTNIRFNTLLGVSSNEFKEEGCYFNLYDDELDTLLRITDINTISSSVIKSEENSTIYSSIGQSSGGF